MEAGTSSSSSAVISRRNHGVVCMSVPGISYEDAKNENVHTTNDKDPFLDSETSAMTVATITPVDDGNGASKKFFRKCCSVKMLKRRLPIVDWLPRYKLHMFRGDLVAGLTVGLTVIPQAVAYAGIANLPPQYGLYSAFMGCFVYIFFGSIKDLSIGPTAILSLLTAEYAALGGPSYAILIAFLGGIIQLAMGFLNLGFVVDFISSPVIGAFTSAAAIIIATTQIRGLLGLKFHSHGFIDNVYLIFKNIEDTNFSDVIMGGISVVVLLFLRHVKNSKWPKNSTIVPDGVKKPLGVIIWIVTTGRNCVIVMICAGIAVAFSMYNIGDLTLTGEVDVKLPRFQVPRFSFSEMHTKNGTNVTEVISFVEACSEIGIAIFLIPLIGVIESIAIAKVFADGKRLDATQEMITLGLANIAGSFVGAYPVTGSFSRSAINANSGIKTQFGGLFTGGLVLLALGLLGPYFRYIPKSALSAMIFVAVIFMIHVDCIPVMWKTKKVDLIPYIITFFSCLGLGLEYGIAIGVGVSILLLMFQHARPKIYFRHHLVSNVRCITVIPDRSIFYPSSEYSRIKIKKMTQKDVDTIVLFDASHISNVDYTSLMCFKMLHEDFAKLNQIIIFINFKDSIIVMLDEIAIKDIQILRDSEDLEKMVIEAITARKLKADDINLHDVTSVANVDSVNNITTTENKITNDMINDRYTPVVST